MFEALHNVKRKPLEIFECECKDLLSLMHFLKNEI